LIQLQVWSPGSTAVNADDVTNRYARKAASTSTTVQNLIDALGVYHYDASKIPNEAPFLSAPLSASEASEVHKLLWEAHLVCMNRERTEEMRVLQRITPGPHSMRFAARLMEGSCPENGRPLFISLHGGGGTTPEVNDAQWKNQLHLYGTVLPAGSLYVCPRAPTNTWNLWHENHIDALIRRLVENLIALEHVDPDRVYLMGYSAGGDGVYKLAPRMADTFAAASMCAGHPNGEPLLSLRNLPFAIQVGAQDGAYNRAQVGREYVAQLDHLATQDGQGGYVHWSQFPNTGHWMNGMDQVSVTWMSARTRNARPKRVVWKQNSDVAHSSFYWLTVKRPHTNALVVVEQDANDKQLFRVVNADQVVDELTIRLDDVMCNLDLPVVVEYRSVVLFNAIVSRTIGVVIDSLNGRGDPRLAFDAEVDVKLHNQ
jgi:hypothetical protein